MWLLTLRKVFPGGSGMVKNLPGMWETTVRSLGWKDPLGKKMATHSSILTWRITWTEEPGRLQSVGSQELDKTHQLIHSFHYLTLSKATSQGNSQTQLWVTSGKHLTDGGRSTSGLLERESDWWTTVSTTAIILLHLINLPKGRNS